MTKISHDSEILADGQQVFTACAFIYRMVNDRYEVFMPKRADTKKFLPGVYEFPGGHIDFGEDMVSGLKREVLEEFGVTIHVADPFFVFTYMNEIKHSHSIEVVYFAQFADEHTVLQLNPEDHSGYDWFSEANLYKAETPEKGPDDIEFQAARKGFALLRGQSLDIA